MLFEIWKYEFYIHKLRKELYGFSIKNVSYLIGGLGKAYFINLYSYRIVFRIYNK